MTLTRNDRPIWLRYEQYLGSIACCLHRIDCLDLRGRADPSSLLKVLNRAMGDMKNKGYLGTEATIVSGADRVALELGRLLMERDRQRGVTADDVAAWVEAARSAADAIVDQRGPGKPVHPGRDREVDGGRLCAVGEAVPEGVSGVAEMAAGTLSGEHGREVGVAGATA